MSGWARTPRVEWRQLPAVDCGRCRVSLDVGHWYRRRRCIVMNFCGRKNKTCTYLALTPQVTVTRPCRGASATASPSRTRRSAVHIEGDNFLPSSVGAVASCRASVSASRLRCNERQVHTPVRISRYLRTPDPLSYTATPGRMRSPCVVPFACVCTPGSAAHTSRLRPRGGQLPAVECGGRC